MILAGDLGGTKANLGLFDDSGGEARVRVLQTLCDAGTQGP